MRLLWLASLLLCSSPAWAPLHAQGFVRLSFQPGRDTTVAGVHLRLEEPDNPAHPTLWQGPLTVDHGATPCKVAASLIREVYLSAHGKLLVVVSISGSSTFVQFFRSSNCARAWPDLKAFTEGVEIEDTHLTVLPACACPATEKPCSCSAGVVYKLGEDQAPHRLPMESNALNREKLGKVFTGTRTIAHPPSSLRPR